MRLRHATPSASTVAASRISLSRSLTVAPPRLPKRCRGLRALQAIVAGTGFNPCLHALIVGRMNQFLTNHTFNVVISQRMFVGQNVCDMTVYLRFSHFFSPSISSSGSLSTSSFFSSVRIKLMPTTSSLDKGARCSAPALPRVAGWGDILVHVFNNPSPV